MDGRVCVAEVNECQVQFCDREILGWKGLGSDSPTKNMTALHHHNREQTLLHPHIVHCLIVCVLPVCRWYGTLIDDAKYCTMPSK